MAEDGEGKREVGKLSCRQLCEHTFSPTTPARLRQGGETLVLGKEDGRVGKRVRMGCVWNTTVLVSRGGGGGREKRGGGVEGDSKSSGRGLGRKERKSYAFNGLPFKKPP